MISTIDAASRVVLSADVRQRAGFEPGTELDVLVDRFGTELPR